jgi:AcrR family transcriptional regulator
VRTVTIDVVMSSSTPTTKAPAGSGAGAHGPLSRERIEVEALRIADADGLAALSMRRLASELGVEAMSLYLHVSNKEAILTGILDRLFVETDEGYRAWEAAHAGASWQDQLRALTQFYYNSMSAHQGATPLLVQIGQTPQRLQFMNTLLGVLRDGGFDRPSAHRAMHVLQNHMVGHALRSHGVTARGRREIREVARQAAADTTLIHVAELEDLAECDTAGAFPLGVEVLIAGLEAMLLQPGAATDTTAGSASPPSTPAGA